MSEYPGLQNVVQMDDPGGPAVAVGRENRGDAVHLHQAQGLGRQDVLINDLGVPRHDVLRPRQQDVFVPLDGAAVRTRNRIGFSGSAVATVVVDDRGDLLDDPKITLHGVIEGDDKEAIEDATIDAIMDAVEALSNSAGRDDEAVAEAARRAIRRALHKAIGKRPVTEVHVVRLSDGAG